MTPWPFGLEQPAAHHSVFCVCGAARRLARCQQPVARLELAHRAGGAVLGLARHRPRLHPVDPPATTPPHRPRSALFLAGPGHRPHSRMGFVRRTTHSTATHRHCRRAIGFGHQHARPSHLAQAARLAVSGIFI